MTRHANEAGLAIIRYYESLRLKAYRDSGGVPTIGWGHTKGVKLGQVISRQTAVALLKEDVRSAEEAVQSCVKVELNDNEFSALVSFTFNVGNSAFCKSTLLKKLNFGRRKDAAQEFFRWRYDNGVELKGLVKRRNSERELFLTPVQMLAAAQGQYEESPVKEGQDV